ncbi:hypothetical protein [Alkalinema sp. FACHB-956]|uniref:hypothetical protein n=1 Tax=Alkalinema sp. FACHB-956 TaxID=2692768 RepID=UPI001687F19D|nr:hypothetical protein [Alkalinema sp. FACHB-956]MBD2328853.1 hypothetical protein [Alkalinema sp. FACHB-956]
MLKSNISSPQGLDVVIDRILATGRITLADRTYLMQMGCSDSTLSFQEQDKINQVMQRLQMGLVRVSKE